MTHHVTQFETAFESRLPNTNNADGLSSRGRLGEEILRQAVRTPKSIAIREGGHCVTYADLARMASHFARRLQQDHNVVAGDRVGVLCQRGGEGLVAAIGVLLAGGVYVPISPEYPPDRIGHILRNSGSRIVLADRACITAVGLAACPVQIEHVASGSTTDYTIGASILETTENGGSSPAYILYTSGSSGQPKGVVVGHAAVLNTFSWMVDCFGLRSGHSFAQKTSWGFTDSLWELFLPLIVGGEVVFIDDATVRDPIALYWALKKSHSVITQFVPPVLSLFLSRIGSEVKSPRLPNLRWVLNGGEEIPRPLVDRWFDLFPDVGFANTYGMTESAIYATCFLMRTPPVWGMRRIPVGRPIHGARVSVLGTKGEQLTTDQIGEICVGGDSLMDGYCNEPELTESAFTKHPMSGDRLYRTGDLGAWRCDGELAYLGRVDDQVKIRGMRVELGEVRHAILQHSSIKHAAVIVCGEGERRYLRAFYTVHSSDPGEESVMVHLRQSLPDYMIPSRCLLIAQMPLTSHGKVDRSLLASIAPPQPAIRGGKIGTPGTIAQTIRSAWRDVLGHDDFGLDHGFFAVGGNSLLLVRVYAALPTEYRRVVALAELLQFPTIRSLAERVLTLLDNHAAVPGRQIDRDSRSRRALKSRRSLRRRLDDEGVERPGSNA